MGSGYAWAGQIRAIVAPPCDVKPLKLSLAGNFGNTLPIGSKEIKRVTLFCLPEFWGRISLSRAEKGDTFFYRRFERS